MWEDEGALTDRSTEATQQALYASAFLSDGRNDITSLLELPPINWCALKIFVNNGSFMARIDCSVLHRANGRSRCSPCASGVMRSSPAWMFHQGRCFALDLWSMEAMA